MKNQKDVKAVLIVLSDGASRSIDDLMVATKLSRADVANVMKVSVPANLIERNADDATRAPVYVATQTGLEFLARAGKGRLPKIEPADTVPAPGSDTPCCNAAKVMAATAADVVAELRADLENARSLVERQKQEIADLKESIQCRDDAIHAKNQRIEQMQAEIDWKGGVIADQSDKINNREMPPEAKPAAYAVARPGKPLRRFKKDANAQADAMASARAGKPADVFALHPVGRAVPGAQWKAVEA